MTIDSLTINGADVATVAAFNDIQEIAELIKDWREHGSDGSYAYDYFSDIIQVLEDGGWL